MTGELNRIDARSRDVGCDQYARNAVCKPRARFAGGVCGRVKCDSLYVALQGMERSSAPRVARARQAALEEFSLQDRVAAPSLIPMRLVSHVLDQ